MEDYSLEKFISPDGKSERIAINYLFKAQRKMEMNQPKSEEVKLVVTDEQIAIFIDDAIIPTISDSQNDMQNPTARMIAQEVANRVLVVATARIRELEEQVKEAKKFMCHSESCIYRA